MHFGRHLQVCDVKTTVAKSDTDAPRNQQRQG